MNQDLWRWADPDGQQRRARLDELRAALASGTIAPNTPVWRSGFTAWVPAHDVPELTSSALSAANGVLLSIPPPPAAMVAVQQEYESLAGPDTVPGGEEEPPPPPKYVPQPVKARDSAPDPLPNIPTAIGLPPPPELAAKVAEAKAKAAGAQAAKSPSLPPPVPARKMNAEEELSSSSLIPVSEPALLVGGPDSLPPPTDPVVHETAFPLGRPSEPDAGGPIGAILADLRAVRAGGKPKNRFTLPVVGLVGGAGVLMVLAGVVSLVKGSGEPKPIASASAPSPSAPVETAAAPSALDSTRPSAVEAPPAAKAATSAVRAVAFSSCAASGEPKVVAPKAMVSVGVEAAAFGADLVVGFAPTPRDGAGAVLAPDTLATRSTLKARAADAVKRVTPIVWSSGKNAVFADGDRKGDKLASRRIVATVPPIDVGVADGNIVWAPHGQNTWANLFGLEGSGPVEALRVIALPEAKGIAIAFRRDGLLWFGAALGDAVLEAQGALVKITPKGQVGSPAIAASGSGLVLAWAERPSADAPWSIRTARAPIGGAASEAVAFDLPPGGLGESGMSPHVASLGNGRALLSWTEGPMTNHQARAVVLDEQGKASGAPIELSAAGMNAGQSQAAVGVDGRGLAVFLGAKGKGYEVVAVPLTCK